MYEKNDETIGIKPFLMNEDKEFFKDVYVAAIAAGCTSNEVVWRVANRALADLHMIIKERGWQ